MQKTTFKTHFPVFLLSIACLGALNSCKEQSSFQIKSIEQRLIAHQDSLQHEFFIPTKSRLKAEVIFYHQLLMRSEQIKPMPDNTAQLDSLKNRLKKQIEKAKSWTTNPRNYNLQKIIAEQFTPSVFSKKNYIRSISLFYQKGIEVLKPESIQTPELHVQEQIDVYRFLKNEFDTQNTETEEALLAVKKFIGFLNSLKNDRIKPKRSD